MVASFFFFRFYAPFVHKKTTKETGQCPYPCGVHARLITGRIQSVSRLFYHQIVRLFTVNYSQQYLTLYFTCLFCLIC